MVDEGWREGNESLQVEAEDATISVGIIVIAVDHVVMILLRVGDLVVVISLEGPVLVGGLGEGGVQGVEVTALRMVLVVVTGKNLGGRLGGHDVAAVAGVCGATFLVVPLLRLLSLPRADDGADAPLGLPLGATGRSEKTLVLLKPALLRLLQHCCRCLHELLLLAVAVAHAVD